VAAPRRRAGSTRARSPPAPPRARADVRPRGWSRRWGLTTSERKAGASLVGGEGVALLEGLPGLQGDALAVVNLHVGPLERQLVPAAGDLVVDDRRVLGGVLAVDPDLGPGDGVDGHRAVAALVALVALVDLVDLGAAVVVRRRGGDRRTAPLVGEGLVGLLVMRHVRRARRRRDQRFVRDGWRRCRVWRGRRWRG